MPKPGRILAVSGSLRPGSANTALLHAAAALAPAGVAVDVFDGLAQLPYFLPGGYDEAPPPAVAAWRARVRAADALLICTPEYVFSMPGVLKNALEWLVPSGEVDGKPTAVWSASGTGGAQAHAGVVAMLTVMQARLLDAAALQIAQVAAKVSRQGEVTDEATAAALQQAVQALAAAVATPDGVTGA